MYARVFASLLLAGSIAAAQDARQILTQSVNTLGDVKTIQYTGSGAIFTVGQNVSPSVPWPQVEVKSFTQTYDYEKGASQTDGLGPQGPTPSQFLSGDRAWGRAGANVNPAAPNVVALRQLQLLMTPHGFLKTALASNATTKGGKAGGQKVTLVSFMQGKQRITGTISGDHLVQRVESQLDNPVLGDMLVETDFSDYRDFSGVKFPARLMQKQGGFPAFDFTVTEVKANVPFDLPIPDAVRDAVPPVVKVASEKLGDGVWYLTGGSHHSVLVEFQNHVAVIEAPLTEARSEAVIAEVKKLAPGKPIRYLISTHHHFDHSGGLRTYIAEGATIVTHQSNKAFYERVAKSPHTLNPDRLSRQRRKAKVLGVGARRVLTDGSQTIEIHHIQGNPHNDGILMAYLPKDKILVEVDVYTPLAPNAAPPATPNPNTVNLYENIERLKLDVGPIAPLHGRLVTLADLRKTIGK
jgi:glyoxylase-like metal-dependent hydrolase (beta-lactamase superfamily II)